MPPLGGKGRNQPGTGTDHDPLVSRLEKIASDFLAAAEVWGRNNAKSKLAARNLAKAETIQAAIRALSSRSTTGA